MYYAKCHVCGINNSLVLSIIMREMCRVCMGPTPLLVHLTKVNYHHTAVTYQGILLKVDIFISTLDVYCHHVGITDVRKIKCHDVVGWNHHPHTHART